MNKNTWFEETFLPSLENKMNTPKYHNSCILSEKQVDICKKYMDRKIHSGDYGIFASYEYDVNGDSCRKHYHLGYYGKYPILSMNVLPREIYVVDDYDYDEHEDYIATFYKDHERREWMYQNVVDGRYNT